MELLSSRLLRRLLMTFGRASHLSDAAIEIWILSLFGCIAALLAHLREMVRAILAHIGLAAFARNLAVVLAAALLFKCGSSLFSDPSVVVISVLVANRTAPLAARLRGGHGRGFLFFVFRQHG